MKEKTLKMYSWIRSYTHAVFLRKCYNLTEISVFTQNHSSLWQRFLTWHARTGLKYLHTMLKFYFEVFYESRAQTKRTILIYCCFSQLIPKNTITMLNQICKLAEVLNIFCKGFKISQQALKQIFDNFYK